MKTLLWLILLATAATGLALATNNAGYVLVFIPPWRVEFSFNLLPILVLSGFLAFYFMLRGVFLIQDLPGQVRAYRARRKTYLSSQKLFSAIRLLFEGRSGQALKQATEAYLSGAPKGLSALIAARATQRMRNPELVFPWVQRAAQEDAQCAVAGLMLQAETQVNHRDFRAALITLEELQKKAGRHLAALRLELRARQGERDWKGVLRVARQLEKRRAITAEHANAILEKAHLEIVRDWQGNAASLLNYLRKMPEREKRDRVIQQAAETLSGLEADTDAQKLLEALLDERHGSVWEPQLIELYGKLPGVDVTARIARAEGWLTKQPKDATLLLTLGYLCTRQQLWGKAQSYLEAALSASSSAKTHLALADLFELLEKPDLAIPHYRAAARLAQS